MDAASELLKLAEEKFGKLTAAEKKLFRAAAEGEIADYSPRSKKPIDPANAAKWGPTRVLLAYRIKWLCTNKQVSQLVAHRGIQIKGARVDEAFELEHAKVPFPLDFEQCKFTAAINFRHAEIAGLNMSGTHVGLLSADGLKADRYIFLRNGFKAQGQVDLRQAATGGDLDCSNGEFINKNGTALDADKLNVQGSVLLRNGFRADGEVCLLNATVRGNLECDNSHFMRKGGSALTADGLKVEGSVFLRKGFRAEGEVRLLRATVGTDLSCEDGLFMNKGGYALNGDGLRVEGNVLLRGGFKVEGIVTLVGTTIRGYFGLTDVDSPEEMTLDLRSTKVGTLCDDQESWPTLGRLLLHGLEYEEIFPRSSRNPSTRIEWLRRQDKDSFSPQPYEQLAKVLRESGDGAGAKDVLIAKNKDKADRTELTRAEWCWYRLFGPLIGYGHKPWLAIPLALVIVLFGSMFFKEGYSHGLITPMSEPAYEVDIAGARRISEEYPVFNSFVYSMDVFVPVVDLHQLRYWLPNANRGSELVPTSSAVFCTGGLLLLWLWIETALGWILTTLFLVGFTGLVRT